MAASKRAALNEVVKQDMDKREFLKRHPEAGEEPAAEVMTTFSIRLPESQKKALQRHFKKSLGLDLSPGIRMILTEYMNNQGI